MSKSSEKMTKIKTETVVPQTGEKAFYGLPYKEPFLPVDNGFGFYGVLLSNDKGLIQCHLCGNWYSSLGTHLFNRHSIDSTGYRELFSFKPSAALISESLRQKRIEVAMMGVQDGRLGASRAPKNRKEILRKAVAKRTGSRTWKTEQWKNEHNNCRGQILMRLKSLAQKHDGRVTAKILTKEDPPLLGYIVREYGKLSYAKHLCNIMPNKTEKSAALTPEVIIEDAKHFYGIYKRSPNHSDLDRGMLVATAWIVKKFFKNSAGLAKAAGLPEIIAGLGLPMKEIIMAYCQGVSLTDLGIKYNCAAQTISYQLRKSGIRVRAGGEQKLVQHGKLEPDKVPNKVEKLLEEKDKRINALQDRLKSVSSTLMKHVKQKIITEQDQVYKDTNRERDY